MEYGWTSQAIYDSVFLLVRSFQGSSLICCTHSCQITCDLRESLGPLGRSRSSARCETAYITLGTILAAGAHTQRTFAETVTRIPFDPTKDCPVSDRGAAVDACVVEACLPAYSYVRRHKLNGYRTAMLALPQREGGIVSTPHTHDGNSEPA